MSLDDRRYGIKPDYQPNLTSQGYAAPDAPDYWTPDRIALSAGYQYDVYKFAAELMQGPGVASVLDVGSGPPMKLKLLLPARPLALHLVDQAQSAPLAARLLPAATFTAANLETVDLDLGRRFDLVICADVIEHLLDPDPCLRFIRRHLSPAGVLLISTPERDILRGRECRSCPHPMHVREWNRAEFADFLQSRGWRIISHRNLPQQRTAAPFRVLGELLDRFGHAPKWYSCQLAACQAR